MLFVDVPREVGKSVKQAGDKRRHPKICCCCCCCCFMWTRVTRRTKARGQVKPLAKKLETLLVYPHPQYTHPRISCTHLPTHPPIHLPARLPTHPPTYVSTHLPIYPPTHPPTRSFPPTNFPTVSVSKMCFSCATGNASCKSGRRQKIQGLLSVYFV